MDGRQSHVIYPSIEARATEFLEQAKVIAAAITNREEAVQLIFGITGPYLALFPTIDDRMAFRELPARRDVFALLRKVPASVCESPRKAPCREPASMKPGGTPLA